jgi:hypothetical protein
MKTPAKVGVTSNTLWWALNDVGLLFASSKCGTTVCESPYKDMILLHQFQNSSSGRKDSDSWNY